MANKPTTVGEVLRTKNRFGTYAGDILLQHVAVALENTLIGAGSEVARGSGQTIIRRTDLDTTVLNTLNDVDLGEFIVNHDQEGND